MRARGRVRAPTEEGKDVQTACATWSMCKLWDFVVVVGLKGALGKKVWRKEVRPTHS